MVRTHNFQVTKKISTFAFISLTDCDTDTYTILTKVLLLKLKIDI